MIITFNAIVNLSLGIFGSLATLSIFFYPASHPATPAPVRGFSWPGCFLSALSQDLCHHSRVFRPVPVLIPRTDPASAPCRSWHYFPRHPVPVQWVLLSSYPPPGFPALVHRYAPRSFMCLLTLCRLCRSLCRVGSPRTDSAPPRLVQLHPGTIPPAVPVIKRVSSLILSAPGFLILGRRPDSRPARPGWVAIAPDWNPPRINSAPP